MSKTIDEKVVSMQFDNRHFEKNVQTSLSTLDKLKQSLNLSGASKGLENVNAAAKNVNMSGLSNGIETVKAKFSALEVMGVTALANITNSAVNAGKRIVSALTIDPVKTGLSEYETQINAVQTILANTKHKGSTLEDVNKALDELNEYADLTIYNFTEMTKNIGLFTNAGVGLNDSVAAIKGFSNAAAMSGADATRTAGAMYQLSQAMSAGVVQLMDWRSLTTANIAGERFQDVLIATAKAHGIAIDEMIAKEGNFQSTLKDKWLTSDLMAEALNHYTLSTETMTEAEIKANKERLKSIGYTDDQIEMLFEVGTEATNAATKIKTFTQMWGVLQETAQSGWAKTWQLIFGDFEEAKNLFTPLTNTLSGFIGKMSDARNALLESALGKGLTNVLQNVNKALNTTKKGIDSVLDPLEDLGTMVNKVIVGDFGNGKARLDALTKSGYNYYRIQNKVNETLGYSFRYSDKVIESQDKLLKNQTKTTEKTEEQSEATIELTKNEKARLKTLVKMSDEQLVANGYTEEQIEAIKELRSQAEKLGIPLDEFIDKLDQINGRWLLIDSFKNIGQGLVSVAKSIGQAWKEAFYGDASDEEILEKRSTSLFNIIGTFHKLTSYLKVSEDAAKKFKRTFKGLFAIFDIVKTIVGGAASIAFKVFSKVLDLAHINILDITAAVGDAIVKFRDWLLETGPFAKVLDTVAEAILSAVNAISKWIKSLWELPVVQSFIEKAGNVLSSVFKKIKEFFSNDFIGNITKIAKSIKDFFIAFSKIPEVQNFISGLKSSMGSMYNGVKEYFSKGGEKIQEFIERIKSMDNITLDDIGNILRDFRDNVLEYFLGFDLSFSGFASKISEIKDKVKGWFTTLTENLSNFRSSVEDNLSKAGDKFVWIKEKLSELVGFVVDNIPAAIAIIMGISLIGAIKKLADALELLATPLRVIEGLQQSLSKLSNALSFRARAEGVKAIAISIGILAASLAVLSQLDQGKLWSSVGALALLMGVLILLANAIGKIEKFGDFSKAAISIVGLAAAMAILAWAMKEASGLTPEGFAMAAGAMAYMVTIAMLLMKVTEAAGSNADKAGLMMIEIGAAFLIMTHVIKSIAGMSGSDIMKGLTVITAFGLLAAGLVAVSKMSGEHASKAGSMILKIAAAMLLMTAVIKIVSGMDAGAIIKGIVVMTAFEGMAILLVAVSKLAGEHASKAGSMIIKIGIAMMAMAAVIKIVSGMSVADIAKGIAVMAVFEILAAGLIAISKLSGENAAKAGAMMLMIAGAMLIMTGVIYILQGLEPSGLVKGLAAITVMGLVFAALIKATQGAQDCMKNLIVLTVAVVALGAVIVALSLLEPDKLAGATAAISLVTGIFTVLVKSMESLGNVNLGKASLSLLMAVGVFLVIVGSLFLVVEVLKSMDGLNNAQQNALALGALAIALGIASIAIAAVGAIIGATGFIALTGIIVLAAIIGALFLVVEVIKQMEGIQNAVSNAQILINILTVLTSLMVVLAIVGPLAAVGVAAMYALVGLIVAIGVLATGIGALMTQFPQLQEFLNTGLPVMIQLAGAIGAMIGAFIKNLAMEVMQILPAFGANLSAFMLAVQPFVILSKLIDESVIKGVGILAAAILVLAVADFISGILTLGGVGLVALGVQLSLFMFALQPFLMGLRSITPEMTEAATSLAGLILALTVADVINGIKSFFGSGVDFGGFGLQLAAFGSGVVAFAESIRGLTDGDLDKVDIAATAGKKMAEMANAIPSEGGLWQRLMGFKDLDGFGESLKTFGSSLVAFSESISGLTKDDLDHIKDASDAASKLVDLANALPSDNGLWQRVTGFKDLDGFGTSLETFGSSLVAFSDTVSTLTEDDISKIETSADAASKLVDVANALPESDGLWQRIAGFKDIEGFGSGLKSLGDGIASYTDYVKGVNDDSIASIEKSGEAVDALKKVAEKVPTEGGWGAAIMGEKDSGGFGSAIKELGSGISSYVKNVKGVNDDSIASIEKSGEAVDALKDVASKVPTNTDSTSNVKPFTDNMAGLIDNLKTYITKANGINDDGITSIKNSKDAVKALKEVAKEFESIVSIKLLAATLQVKQLSSAISDMSKMDFSGATSLSEALDSLGKAGVDDFVKAFGSSAITKARNAITNFLKSITNAIKHNEMNFYTAGVALMNRFAIGITSGSRFASKSSERAGKSALSGVKNYRLYNDFYSAGSNLVSGFANGITANTFKAEARAKAMAKAAYEAAKEALDVNSPSKVFRKLGTSVPEGFAMGIDMLGGTVSDSSISMARTAIDGTKNAISRIADTINSDIDAQPTIRPVLDLSDIKSGAGSINGMLNMQPSVGMLSKVGTISSMMNRNQNGTNNDVISAINELGSKLGNTSGNTYNVNGITYDDGTNISEAVKVLVRAARVERRV